MPGKIGIYRVTIYGSILKIPQTGVVGKKKIILSLL